MLVDVAGNAGPRIESTLRTVVHRVRHGIHALWEGYKEIKFRSKPWAHKGLVWVAYVDLIILSIVGLVDALTDSRDRYNTYMWLTEMCAAVYLFYVAIDAVANENPVQLIVFNIGNLFMAGRLWVVFLFSMGPQNHDRHRVMEIFSLITTAISQILFIAFSFTIYDGFGRHVFFKVGAKESLVRVYRRFQVCMAILKGDVVFSTVLLLVAVYYYALPTWMEYVCGLLYAVGLYYSIAVLDWCRRERRSGVNTFCACSLVVPCLALVGLIRLHADDDAANHLRNDAAAHYLGEDPDANETFYLDENAADAGDSALVVLTAVVIACVTNRLGAICGLFWVSRTIYGQGLAEALFRSGPSDNALTNSSLPLYNPDAGGDGASDACSPSSIAAGGCPTFTFEREGAGGGGGGTPQAVYSDRLKAYGTPRANDMSVQLLESKQAGVVAMTPEELKSTVVMHAE